MRISHWPGKINFKFMNPSPPPELIAIALPIIYTEGDINELYMLHIGKVITIIL